MSAYDTLPIHRTMLADTVRTDAFRRAIEEVVQPGDRVLDFGCGLGILSFFALRAGAGRVYAVDRSTLIHAARRIAADNDLTGVVFLQADGETLALPEPVDVIVSEWLGSFALAEGMLATLLRLRDRWLAPGGRMMPATVSLHAALVTDADLHEELAYWRGRPWGFDYSFVADWAYHRVLGRRVPPEHVLGRGTKLAELELGTLDGVPATLEGELVARRPGEAHGICAWFDTSLSPRVGFSTSPTAPRTHWRQLVFPLLEPLPVEAAQRVSVRLHPDPGGAEWRWAIKDGGRWRYQDNYVQAAWLQAQASLRLRP